MTVKIACIGMGNMATALVCGFLKSGKMKGEDIIAYDPATAKVEKMSAEWGILSAATGAEAAAKADIVLMACKPQHVGVAINEIKGVLAGKALLSIVLGWSKYQYEGVLPRDTRVQSIMPNTPAMVGEGMFLFEEATTFTGEELAFVKDLFSAIGEVVTLPTALMGIGGAISGCGPAFVDLLLEAFADAGVLYGLPRDVAQLLISKTVLGAAKLQIQTGEKPGALKDMVCSPGGSTIKGVAALEEADFRGACIKAIKAIMAK